MVLPSIKREYVPLRVVMRINENLCEVPGTVLDTQVSIQYIVVIGFLVCVFNLFRFLNLKKYGNIADCPYYYLLMKCFKYLNDFSYILCYFLISCYRNYNFLVSILYFLVYRFFTSLVKFIPSMLFFSTILNELFLSLSDSLLLVYRNATKIKDKKYCR